MQMGKREKEFHTVLEELMAEDETRALSQWQQVLAAALCLGNLSVLFVCLCCVLLYCLTPLAPMVGVWLAQPCHSWWPAFVYWVT